MGYSKNIFLHRRVIKELRAVVKSIRKDAQVMDDFFKYAVLHGLFDEDGENWKSFLRESPRSINDFINRYDYVNVDLLREILSTLVNDNLLKVHKHSNNNGEPFYELVNDFMLPPTPVPNFFGPHVTKVMRELCRGVGSLLRGAYREYTDEYRTFTWDLALTAKMYEVSRRCLLTMLSFKPNTKFLDIGCGPGYSTVSAWRWLYDKGFNRSDSNFPRRGLVEVHGLDPTEEFLRIARAEYVDHLKYMIELFDYYRSVRNRDDLIAQMVEAIQQHPPTFTLGNAEEIPYDDNTFDYALANFVLHWTNIPKVLEEIHRVLKPGGVFVSFTGYHPFRPPYYSWAIRTVKGAHGFIDVRKFEQICQNVGFEKPSYVVPIVRFTILKKKRN